LSVKETLDVCQIFIETENSGAAILTSYLAPVAIVLSAFIAALVATSSSKRTHLLDKKRDVILEITSEIANLRMYVVEKVLIKSQEYNEEYALHVRREMLEITKKLVLATDKFYVISSDSNSARLEKLYFQLIEKLREGIDYHYNPTENIIPIDYLCSFNDLRADVIEVLNNELNDSNKTLKTFKSAIKATNTSATKMFKTRK
jgi:hypothetical protein